MSNYQRLKRLLSREDINWTAPGMKKVLASEGIELTAPQYKLLLDEGILDFWKNQQRQPKEVKNQDQAEEETADKGKRNKRRRKVQA